ncbi:hypothetical protein EVAR_32902_1 [Eumeta japonica]|uniref:Uncharacterized protein n=1 Tax=Eumeta variegata TaxID=151549 RepID=A0A4C1VRC3_EUMVA|nr:hypothetical protein EVAR_32902_1 [Eumeta japonica]
MHVCREITSREGARRAGRTSIFMDTPTYLVLINGSVQLPHVAEPEKSRSRPGIIVVRVARVFERGNSLKLPTPSCHRNHSESGPRDIDISSLHNGRTANRCR